MTRSRLDLDERFTGETLDPDVWVPYYLPHWSSRAQSAATYSVHDGELHLSIPDSQPLWCADLHDEPLRVSCIQSGCFSGPLGSTIGQQPFREGLEVREEQPTMWGYTPHFGQVEVRMRGVISQRSMFAFWMSGIEDLPERSAEICVAEVFGDAVRDSSADVGIGLHRFRDPALSEEFSADPLGLDVTEFHTYGVDWRPGSLAFLVDDEVVRRCDQAPDYPMQLMIGLFDFPAKATGGVHTSAPELVVSHVRGKPLS
ncbi:glycoside hydrolase family 16 protein [Phytoactinopolyspora alkaliphila]|uniref:Glycoside hydrolase family 16 protein n=1 Tax=Phytoactinopolyspora alkaliphila TaxID=1783498 RepID=A0A6N9YMP3_9ACTN|nr:glycoside hydrolase family 16 protein [Phytoactinopolyspora alkaliphila]NED96242.1 glycoside hydrolase family 16 protein [Phytoactinopolyspora alkaliphila]